MKKKEFEEIQEEDLHVYKADKKFYLKKDLSEDQIEFLKDKGFIQVRYSE